MDKINTRKRGRFTRKLIQLYAAVLYNCYARGFIKGDIYTGKTKLLCAPGLNCYSCPGAVAACPLGALQNAVAASQSRAPAYMLGILLFYGLLLGHTVCGWLCPMGLIQELLHKLPTPKIEKGRLTRALSYFKYGLLFALVFLVPYWYSYQLLPLPAFCKYVCPAGTLGGALGLMLNPENYDKLSLLGYLFTNKFVILIALLCLSVFLYRVFCRFLCPLGAIYGLFSKVALIGVKVEKSACVDCGLCVSRCKMDIRRVGDHECIHCGDCIDACPTGAIRFTAGKITLRASEGIGAQGAGLQNTKKRKLRTSILAAALIALLIAVTTLVHLNDPAKARKADSAEKTPAYTVDETIPVGKEVGMRARDFTAARYGGGEDFSLSACLGRPVVLNFWATWCGPCVVELPYFDQLYREYGQDVAVIALHSQLVTDDVEKYLANYDYALPFGLDADGGIIASFGGSTMLPQTVVIDKNGVITYNAVGSMSYEKVKVLVEESLGR